MFSFLDPVLLPVHDLLDALSPVVPAGLAVVLLTLALRLVLHPLNRRTQHQAVRRRELEPRLAQLRSQHAKDPQAMQRAVLELHREEGVPLAPGCLTALLQVPVFGMVYRLFTAPEIAGAHNRLLDHTVLGTPLSQHLVGAGAGDRWIFLVLIGLTLTVAAFSAWQLRRHMAEDRAVAAQAAAGRPSTATQLSAQQQAMADSMEQVTKVMPLLSFLTVAAVASLPLAAGLYLVTSTMWGLLERASLRRIRHGRR
ncbi:membrane protein insertase YidC [Ornithinimicrobium pekingense]|uniref:Membrane protein insertase YidC n=1 Tax=Ornithinimicrobium pekingense TaxID=384677 RepID=A0ABQ2FAK8_9MICO|nr:membrane protein insertase YidC [Ornithinimicrobium pekingense]GGK76913.1 membrane protein [Ornithinimicrobium pekingense]